MRLYFHLQEGAETIRDDVGVEVSDLETGKKEALSAIGEMLRQPEAKPHGWAGWKLAAADESGALLFSFDLGALH